MFSSVFGILCASIIMLDFLEVKEVGLGWLIACWCAVFVDSLRQVIEITIKEDD